MQRDSHTVEVSLAVIIGGLMIWGAFHALGAYLSLAQKPGWSYQSEEASAVVSQQQAAQPPVRDPRKAVVVGVCSAGFISFWLLMLVLRRRRARRLAETAGERSMAATEDPGQQLPATAASQPAGSDRSE
ncbi:MAG: hypothetical protein J5I93_17335 [Pirellulaceae bacterium]|nr:hypothetical protein [Pirellulaceae bacterium]